jgi:cyclase
MRLHSLRLLGGLAITGASVLAPACVRALDAQAPAVPPGAQYTGAAFTFRPVADGVWFAVGTGVVSAESNHAIVELGDAVLVVDAGTSPAAAWALLHELPRVTRKPVKWLVVTHMHYDHAHGTQSFPAGVEVIGTEYTRAQLAAGKSVEHPTAIGNRNFSNTQIQSLTTALDTATTPASTADITKRRAVWEQYLASLATLTPVAPTMTVSQRLTIARGGREVQVIFPGRAHTDGDLVVWLPKERVLVTGDLLQPNVPYLGDGYLNDWADVLDAMIALRPAVVLPGHGDEFRDLAVAARLRDYLRAIWTQCAEARAKGLTPEQAAAALDLTRFDPYYPRFPGWTEEMVVRRRLGTVRRVYQLLDER